MPIKSSLVVRPEQGFSLTPAMKQSLEILQMTECELAEYVDQALLENPLLERVEIDKDANLDVFMDAGSERANMDTFALSLPQRMTLWDCLNEQLWLSDVGAEERRITEFLIGCVDERGYITITEVDAAALLSVSTDAVKSALCRLQSYEPAGVGARNLIECLTLQLDRHGDEVGVGLARTVINWVFQSGRKRSQEMAELMNTMDSQHLKAAARLVRSLDPRPGLEFGSEMSTHIVPDVVLSYMGDRFVVQLSAQTIPALQINHVLADLTQTHPSLQTRQYITQKIADGMGIIRGIEARRRTLLRVVEEIVSAQTLFLEHGVRYLRPLSMKAIAQNLRVHESTISRAVSGKFAATPHGVVELKDFFSRAAVAELGQEVSVQHVLLQMADLIRAEDPQYPLSDQEISTRLNELGVTLSRRTVAKYREQLDIPSSTSRRLVHGRFMSH